MSDTEFKNRPITFAAKWAAHSAGCVIGSDRYKPDRSFKDESGEVICVIESSSTNDRKVEVGELCLADKFFSGNKTDGVLIFSLCGKSDHPPRPDTQTKYLEPYFRHLKAGNRPHGVREMYFIAEDDFASSGWVALHRTFLEKAYVLKA